MKVKVLSFLDKLRLRIQKYKKFFRPISQTSKNGECRGIQFRIFHHCQCMIYHFNTSFYLNFYRCPALESSWSHGSTWPFFAQVCELSIDHVKMCKTFNMHPLDIAKLVFIFSLQCCACGPASRAGLTIFQTTP